MDVLQIPQHVTNNILIARHTMVTSHDVMSNQGTDVVMIVVVVIVPDEIIHHAEVEEIAHLTLRWIVRVTHILSIAPVTLHTIYVRGHI